MITVGMPAPDFTLPSDEGTEVSLSQFKGKRIVLYFYPKDDTPGCTTEACQFRDVYDDFLEAGAVVIGISPDSVSSHTKFKAKHGLPFFLLADHDKAVIESYGALQEKRMYGKTYMGIQRSTFVIDEQGIVTAVFPKVKADGHAREVLDLLNA